MATSIFLNICNVLCKDGLSRITSYYGCYLKRQNLKIWSGLKEN